jgi:hypothetical protein
MSEETPVSEELPRPLLRVVKGNPTPSELAALAAVVAAVASTPPATPRQQPQSQWAKPQLRTPINPRQGW